MTVRATARRSLQVVLALAAVGVVLALSGARATWVTVTASAALPRLGEGVIGTAGVTGDDLAAFSGIALLGLLVALGITFTRGRGRWPVGLGLAACGVALIVLAPTEGNRATTTALDRASSGRLETVPATASLDADGSALGPVLVTVGGLSLALAGAETLRRGPAWPAMGDAFRAPGDRPTPTPRAGDPDPDGEPPWQGA